MAVMIVPSGWNSMTACTLSIAAIFPAKSAFLDLLLSDVRGEFHDLHHPALVVEDRVVGGGDPDLSALLVASLKLADLGRTPTKVGPKRLVVRTAAVVRIHKHAVMLALNLVQSIAHRAEEVVVGRNDRAVGMKLDDRLNLIDRRHLPREVRVLDLLLGDVGGELHDLQHSAVVIEDRIVRGRDPNLSPLLIKTLELADLRLAASKLGPKRLVVLALAV